MIEKNKESQNQSLAELQQELKSLKALLLSRGPATSATPSSPLPIFGRPSIPAWQLASSPAANQPTQPSSPQPAPSASAGSFSGLLKPPTVTATTSSSNGSKETEVESSTDETSS